MDLPVHIEITAFTDRGRLRSTNEDAITAAGWIADVAMSEPRRSRHDATMPLVVALADGMGGQAAGEVASRYVVKRLAAQRLESEREIAEALAAINAELYAAMAADPELMGMGTTVAGLVLTARRALWFHVGDSRVYRHRNGRLQQMSIDDVPVGPRSGIITQTLGGAPAFVPVSPHIGGEALAPPARYLLCSDGLTDMLDAGQIAHAMAATDADAVGALFTEAMQAGGADNISIVLVSIAASAG
jgi:serine/threonine protein phosphatase PrpC